MSSILLFSEKEEVLSNLISAGVHLREIINADLYAILIGKELREKGEKLLKMGIDKLIRIEIEQETLFPESYADLLQKMVEKYNPELVLIGATPKGKEIAPRLAAKQKAGCITECTGFEVSDSGELIFKRMIFGGIVTGFFTINTALKICTIHPEHFEAPEPTGNIGEVVVESVEFSVPSKRLIDVKKIKKTVDLSNAEKIVSVGRGLSKKEDLDMIFELASLIGAEVGCSRPLAEDFKWLPKERQVGLTGETVKPKIYMAIGISGQIQHFVGMKETKTVVAINKSKDAPIFQQTDYGIIGDLYKVVPLLISALKNQQ
jgi:electron transfer flavoprotein alpha subunit